MAMTMESTKLSALLLILMLSVSSAPVTLACGFTCVTPTPKAPKGPITVPPIKPPITLPPIIGKPPITLPPIIGKPPITLPPIIGKPPITLPPIVVKPPITLPPIIGKPPITLPPIIGKPPITLPPIIGKPPIMLPPIIGKPPIILPPIIGKPPITLPPITVPPITVPPVIGGTPPVAGKACCQPPLAPVSTCPIDTLKFGSCLDVLSETVPLGDPAVTCCPLVEGLSGVAAAACLCTTIKTKLLDTNVYIPLALKLLVTCGNAAPPGYTCP